MLRIRTHGRQRDLVDLVFSGQGKRPKRGTWIQDVPVPASSAGASWHHTLLEQRVRRLKTLKKNEVRLWALLLSSARPLSMVGGQWTTIGSASATLIVGGNAPNFDDRHVLELLGSGSAAVISAWNSTWVGEAELVVDGSGIPAHIYWLMEAGSNMQASSLVPWEAFENGRDTLIATR